MCVNSQSFSKEQIENNEMTEFVNMLCKLSYGEGSTYNDIRIRPTDCGGFAVEWAEVPWDHQYGGSFEYVDEDQVVVKEYVFPDNHTELCYNDDDFVCRLNDFLKENPGWEKTAYGTWTNTIANEKFSSLYEKDEK